MKSSIGSIPVPSAEQHEDTPGLRLGGRSWQSCASLATKCTEPEFIKVSATRCAVWPNRPRNDCAVTCNRQPSRTQLSSSGKLAHNGPLRSGCVITGTTRTASNRPNTVRITGSDAKSGSSTIKYRPCIDSVLLPGFPAHLKGYRSSDENRSRDECESNRPPRCHFRNQLLHDFLW